MMISQLGYPKSLIAVEKDLGALGEAALCRRRVDIVCYMPGSGGLRPLLLIECKAGSADDAAEKQVLGYNNAIGAPFVALVSGKGIRTFWREGDNIGSVLFLPRFQDLVAKL